MKKYMVLFVTAVLATVAGASVAGVYEDGRAAFAKSDYATAAIYFRKAAEQGNGQAQDRLAYLLANGLGVPRDDAEALKWYRLAADQGVDEALMEMGTRYKYGNGVAKNAEEALKWRRLAAERGNVYAQKELGDAYANGEVVAKDYVQAAKWYRLAGKQGDGASLEILGDFYANGQGVAKDVGEAARLYQLAGVNGDVYAKYKLEALQKAAAKAAQPPGPALVIATQDLDGAAILIGRRDYKAAIQLLVRLLAVEPGAASALQGDRRARAFNDLGYAYNQTDDYSLAEYNLTQALALTPNSVPALVNRAIARAAVGRYDPAQEDLLRARRIANGGDSATVTQLLGQLADMRRQEASAASEGARAPGAARAANSGAKELGDTMMQTLERQRRENCARAAQGANISCVR